MEYLQALPLSAWLVAPLAVFAGYLVFGIGGFGATIVMVPLLAHFMPIKFVVPLTLLLDSLAAVLLRANKGGVGASKTEIRWILPFMLVGMASGTMILKFAPEFWLMLALGTFVFVYALFNLLGKKGAPGNIARWWGAPISALGGVGSAIFGTGGPIYVIYIARRIHDPGQLRATMSSIIAVAVFVRLVIFSFAGLLLKPELGWGWLFLCPFLALGLYTGMQLHSRMKPDDIRRSVYALLVVSGGSLVVRALAGL